MNYISRYTATSKITPHQLQVVNAIFLSIDKATAHGYQYDHSQQHQQQLTISIEQIQDFTKLYCNCTYKQHIMLDALSQLTYPLLITPQPKIIHSTLWDSEQHVIVLEYDDKQNAAKDSLIKSTVENNTASLVQMPDPNNTVQPFKALVNTLQQNLSDAQQRELHLNDQLAESERREMSHKTIINELLQCLHSADSEYRISLTANEILDLTENNHDPLCF